MSRRLSQPFLIAVVLAGVAIADGSALAHHGRGNRYIMGAPIELQGTIRELVWRNPHIAILIDVPDEDGETVTWIIEHSNVSTLARMGYHRNTLRPGQPVTAIVNPSSSGDASGLCDRIILEDGTVVFVRGASVD